VGLLPIIQTAALLLLAGMGFWLRAEFFKFKDETIQPLVDRFNRQFQDHSLALADVKSVTVGLQATVIDIRGVTAQMADTIKEVNSGINERTLELGRHDERIKGLTERVGHLETFTRARRRGERETPG